LLNGKYKTGPFTIEELRQKEINNDFLAWTEGMSKWKSVNEMDEIKGLVKKGDFLPPLTPHELKRKLTINAIRKSISKAFLWALLILLIVFALMGGFASDDYLEKVYTRSGDYQVFSSSNEIRWIIIPFAAFFYVTLPISILVGYFNYRKILSKDEKDKERVIRSASQSMFLALVLPILIVLLVAISEVGFLTKILPYIPLYILIIFLLLFHWFYRWLKTKGETPPDRTHSYCPILKPFPAF